MLCVNCPWYDVVSNDKSSTDKNDCLAFIEEGFCPYGKSFPNEDIIKELFMTDLLK